MKFIADVMLGRLAKRMRLLGFDILYDRKLNDNEIIRLSLEQDRIILTRDRALVERPLAANHLFIYSDHAQEQLKQLLTFFSCPPHTIHFTRCSECNTLLVPISKEEAKDLVPRYVYDKNDEFLQCLQCGRIYWKGTHLRRLTIPEEKK
jgi:uncharacterized protein